MSKSYFAILGVSKEASMEEIRSAYRKLVKAYHPDHFNGGNMPFMQIQEAYSVLSDHHRRREHQRALEASAEVSIDRPIAQGPTPRRYRTNAPEPLVPEQNGVSDDTAGDFRQALHPSDPPVDDVPNQIAGCPARRKRTRTAGTPDAIVEVPLTMRQVRQGGSIQISVPTLLRCSACSGIGAFAFYRCARCHGHGAIAAELPLRISFPPGMTRAEQTLKVSMQRFGVPDINLTIIFRAHPADSQ